MAGVKRALISVSDKRGVAEFAKRLSAMGVEILSTGGTAKALREAGVETVDVARYAGSPEMLGGRVKTLCPKVHAGILARREVAEDAAKMEEMGYPYIDLVCVNLYPFAQTVAKENCSLEDAIENIDIGGPAMVRSAAKNWRSVAAVVDPDDYGLIAREMEASQGEISLRRRFELARKAFGHTASYDAMISQWLSRVDPEVLSGAPKLSEFPDRLNASWVKVEDLRYGENPHQRGAWYKEIGADAETGGVCAARQLQGKELSYNNIADADAAWATAWDLGEEPACVIIKHANPCGAALGSDALDAYLKAFQTDPTSAFGGIIAFNRPVDGKTAAAIVERQFMEVILAPEYSPEALEELKKKKNARVLLCPGAARIPSLDMKKIVGGMLVQTADAADGSEELKIATKRKPTAQELEDLRFAWRLAKRVKSNAIVYAKGKQAYGVGAGQMSRVDSAIIAARKAADAKLDLKGAVAASDAFFPFRDGLDVIADQGVTAVIHPGGSIRDQEVIDAANERGVAMVLTGMRHFRH